MEVAIQGLKKNAGNVIKPDYNIAPVKPYYIPIISSTRSTNSPKS